MRRITAARGATTPATMQIDATQMSLLGRACFNARLARAIRTAYPSLSAAFSDAEFDEAFDVQRAVAHAHGLEDERSAASFVHAAWLLGNGFDLRIPAVARLLKDEALSAREKARALDEFTRVVFGIVHDHGGSVPA